MKKIIATKSNDAKTLILELDHPPGNSFHIELLEGLSHWLSNTENDPTIHSIIITGHGKLFSVGGDIYQMKENLDKNTPSAFIDKIVPIIHKIILQITDHNLPIIAAINGSAAGGGLSLAMACDHRLSTSKAKFGMAFGKIGLTPDSGSSLLFPLRFGQSMSLRGISMGKIFSADQLLDKGAIDAIFEEAKLIDEAKKIAAEYAEMDRVVVSNTKKLINKTLVQILRDQLNDEFDCIKESTLKPAFANRLNKFLNSGK